LLKADSNGLNLLQLSWQVFSGGAEAGLVATIKPFA
jgi:hypothetical protein